MNPSLYRSLIRAVSLLALLLLSEVTGSVQAQGVLTGSRSFSYSGQIVTWAVPSGVTSLTIEARGAEGGPSGPTYLPGKGAFIEGVVAVTPGQQLSILVGQQPSTIPVYGTNGGAGARLS